MLPHEQKAFAPTIALLGCTGKPGDGKIPILKQVNISAGIYAVLAAKHIHTGTNSHHTSSSDALPARSPKPLIVHSTGERRS